MGGWKPVGHGYLLNDRRLDAEVGRTEVVSRRLGSHLSSSDY